MRKVCTDGIHAFNGIHAFICCGLNGKANCITDIIGGAS